MRGIHGSYAVGRYSTGNPTFGDIILGGPNTFKAGASRPTTGVVWNPGYSFGSLNLSPSNRRELIDSIALLDITVDAPDTLSGDFGNDAEIANLHSAIQYLRASWGVSGPVGLIGWSMGNALNMAYTLAHPTEVAFIAGINPLTDLTLLHADATYTTPINNNYGGAYSEGVYGATHNPVTFAASLPSSLPIKLWYATDDTVLPASTATAFQTVRPATLLQSTTGGHTDTAVGNVLASVVSWIDSLT